MSARPTAHQYCSQACRVEANFRILWGNPNHLTYLKSSLREAFSEDKLHILVAARNAGSQTYDGIELGGERITQEIEEEMERLARDGQPVRKISIIGYSLGGLISRYAIGLMYHKGWFDKIEPNFTTFATPHLGVRTPLIGVWNQMWNVLGARMLSASGRQLFTIDSFRNTGRPLLANLADPESVFIKGLAKFKYRSLYCNVVNDRSVVYYSAGISRTDPFTDPEAVKINYLKGYEDVILDPDNPVAPKQEQDDVLPTFYKRLAGKSYSMLRRLPLMLFLVVFIPIALVLFTFNSAIQSVRSSRRIRLHAEGKSGINTGAYSIPLLVDEVRREAEEMFEGMNHNQEYLPSGSEELATPAMSKSTVPKAVRTKSDSGEKLVLEQSDEAEDEAPHHPENRKLEFPTLALTSAQFAMIQALDDVGFRKYPVYIHKERHSHAAIIVRKLTFPSSEGKLVVKHWLSEFEV
ncbi:hypothetical protein SLS55_010517 [Diplodia seriata]|uniref:DUF676 domain-containing protein n=1 Tax=Diplodia seriata TaxID=420778 RepID=A0ABR3BXE8_9PEZI